MRKNKLELICALRSISLSNYRSKPIIECDSDHMVKFGLAIIDSVCNCNYNRFMKLYQYAPLMSGYLIDYMINKIRFQLLIRLLKSYGSSNITLESIMQQLHYRSIKECYQYIFIDMKCIYITTDSGVVGTKRSFNTTSNTNTMNVQNYSLEQYKSIIIDCKGSSSVLSAKLNSNDNLVVY